MPASTRPRPPDGDEIPSAAAKARRVLPGFNLTLAHLSLVVLIPLAAVFLKTATLSLR